MSIKHLLSFAILLGLFITSCSETKTESKYANWKERNEHFIDSVSSVYEDNTDPDLFRVQDQRNLDQYIYYKILKSGDQTSDVPNLTSKVNVFYRGMLINEAVMGNLDKPRYLTRAYRHLDIFDENFTGDNPQPDFDLPTNFTVNSLINGFTEILQHMHVGDRWEVYIPYQSGYGIQDSGMIRAYSSLVFDITLFDITDL
ncbi:FKBP-type peptidyl-prolyl cis-trans isomerase [Bacteroides propionicifaciens]|jgi:FKBP-type peptidyl-prolyl cis-trans isomerase FklB|uniref:FKBP-type peptidyl-prolyl cis-trans isomerase n=1 Tax=Bacteroides propionicifaciens TaxID=392838 RepID=UPI00037E5576|nr:FKBP-type peptidyl-prolyl cis-trans isomerase [Bacteroides propionicifaciens]